MDPTNMATVQETSSRESQLLNSIDNYLRVHEAWSVSPDDFITEAYEDALNEAIDAAEDGDVPRNCRKVVFAMDKLAEEWDKFQRNTTANSYKPQASFWRAVEAVQAGRKAAAPVERPPMESVRTLIDQKVTHRQIAENIYGYKGQGPFLKNGAIQSHLIEQEAERPGSVIPKDWVHPMYLEKDEEERKLQERRTRRARAAAEQSEAPRKPLECPESIEDLLLERVSVAQICRMKGCEEAEVLNVARRLNVSTILGTKTFRDPPSLAAPSAEGGESFNGDEDGESDDENHEASELTEEEIKQEVYAMADQGLATRDIAQQLNINGHKVGAILRCRVKVEQPAADLNTL